MLKVTYHLAKLKNKVKGRIEDTDKTSKHVILSNVEQPRLLSSSATTPFINTTKECLLD
jgi:hypothetical protein